MSIAIRIARRELRGGLKGFRIFLACLALGVAAIAAVGSVREAIESGLTREGAVILGGDAEMSFTYRFADASERAFMDQTATRVSETVDFRSMVVVDRNGTPDRALTQVRGVDGAYPLYGRWACPRDPAGRCARHDRSARRGDGPGPDRPLGAADRRHLPPRHAGFPTARRA
jgi:putative ABC transport system permease protein